MNLEKIKKIDWQYLVNRREALLCVTITENSYEFFKKTTGIPWKVNFILHFGERELFYSAKELARLREIFKNGGINLFKNFRQRLIYFVKNQDLFAEQIEKMNCSRLSQKELLAITRKYFKNALYTHTFLLPLVITDRVVSKMILEVLSESSASKKQEMLATLTYPVKENEHVKEEKSFYHLAALFEKKSKNLELFINKHLEQFAHFGARGYWLDESWQADNIKNRLENFFAQNKNPRKERKYLDSIRKETAKAREKLMKNLVIRKSENLYQIIKLAQEFAYLRTWRTDKIYGAGFKARGLFGEIARRANLHLADVSYLTFSEVLKAIQIEKSPITLKELAQRKLSFVTIFYKKQYVVLSGQRRRNRLEKIVQLKVKKTTEIKGNIAFKGKAKGKVKVVFATFDLKKVEPGDILVAVMTFPHFISAMEKAAAFVTDEGGILCHAAIVSREMKKPCIIGTKIATKVLKDRDLVEVNANTGLVKILKKSK